MGTVATDRWLVQFSNRVKTLRDGNKLWIHYQELIEPLIQYFPEFHPQHLHRMLLAQGMFLPDCDIEESLAAFQKKQYWQKVEQEYQWLKKNWQGPGAKVFLFPLEERNAFIMNKLGGKTGISFWDRIFLFLSKKTTDQGLKALVTHEYHHVCRLAVLKKPEQELTLLDSLIIEGLAEYAVFERLGKREVGIWTSIYQKDDLKKIWKQSFSDYLELKGKQRHAPFLFGDKRWNIPQWAGYALGFEMVQSTKLTTKKLLSMSSEEILEQSSFLNEDAR